MSEYGFVLLHRRDLLNVGSSIKLPAANFHHIKALRENYQLLFTSFHKSKARLVSKF